MLELLAPLGFTAACSFGYDIMKDLAKDSAKDFAKDYCNGSMKNVLLGKDAWWSAVAKGLKEFLEQFELELVSSGVEEGDLKDFKDDLKHFLERQEVSEFLGEAITSPDTSVDANRLLRIWKEMDVYVLRDDFDWAKLCRRYQNKARAILRNSPELRALLDSLSLETAAAAAGRLAGVSPDFDLNGYAEGLRKCYGYLKLESLDVNTDHQKIALTRIFVGQNVRYCQKFNPSVLELPVEHRRRLKE